MEVLSSAGEFKETKKKRKKREKDWWLVYVNYTAAGLCTDTALGRTPVVSD